jgi:hypothetical protein
MKKGKQVLLSEYRFKKNKIAQLREREIKQYLKRETTYAFNSRQN